MKHLAIFLTVMTLLGGCAAHVPPAAGPNITVLGETGRAGGLPRDDQVYKGAVNGISDALVRQGFRVFDETMVLPANLTDQFSLTQADIIDLVRRATRPPIDIAVIFSIHGVSETVPYARKFRMGVSARMIDVASGRILASHDAVTPGAETLPLNCDRNCRYGGIARQANLLAADLGAVLAARLREPAVGVAQNTAPVSSVTEAETSGAVSVRPAGASAAYVLVFRGLDATKGAALEDAIENLSGYEHHRMVSTGLGQREYWYESSAGAEHLERALRAAVERLGVTGSVVFNGSSFVVEVEAE
ncbi:MAG: hypothetical protein CMM77_00370 [Rhodospirillaceae bacterium]|jgi:hypothetical protein|nr:hypothetical protein [Rhodospirillaceae bacterium]